MHRGYSDAPVTNLNRKPKEREETWFDRVVQYAFFMVLGAFCMALYCMRFPVNP